MNLSTSGNRSESIKILVDIDTPPEVMDVVVAAMQAVADEMPTEVSSVGGTWRDAAVPMKFTLNVWFDFTHNGTNLGRCTKVRNRMHVAVAQALTQEGVEYTWPALRKIDEQAILSRRRRAKEAGRRGREGEEEGEGGDEAVAVAGDQQGEESAAAAAAATAVALTGVGADPNIIQ